ncbi:hypothetical protein NYL07_17675 [Xanthomonas translucens pv. translucens]|uniref:hypothetical protein n=1 Tax=Xanthomonas campestris pv. translucens TaxID=343 RepID=UPI001F2F448E|nr:hypothetical protein [Xanthomonas translucens]MCS3361636.1 hypothetical protein [Xanthomonas translucens pv. translucens]MCS3373824.1 hypothetical protein [Xanthomonas translucens pv. translucens]MCT8290032.1 hypothetical protein [Xanthomonas translucens pv. translucens]MCT8293715.1 hypothetical protein [Xanthomonas translucens pv. translucens]MCT8313875.1 hypothetical protein [Xanthomonas translucens pv. translucens]
MLSSVAQLAATLEGRFVFADWHNVGADHERTLQAWRDNARPAWPRLHAQRYERRFRRVWRSNPAGRWPACAAVRAAVAAAAVARRCTETIPRTVLNGRGWSAPHNSR